MVAISPMVAHHARKTVSDLQLAFPLLLDAGNRVAADFGLVFTLPEELREVYRGFGIDLERFNGTPDWTLAMPARYVIDTDGTILAAQVNADYTERPEPEETLQQLRRRKTD
ncbi:AhpC/TSA family protein [Geothermobacter ehrlichii]|uniref:AhpC/TSA family protein n=1 Tax=Geothermobacter ehrlichii TaxID=213224 RepID=A0A5D3WKJ0_9BACT|nr:AhpC/TSA family protein [Geothermobacter ehrlichii]